MIAAAIGSKTGSEAEISLMVPKEFDKEIEVGKSRAIWRLH
jgi:hypothetical protein